MAGPRSERPFPVRLVDVAAEAGLTMKLVFGDEVKKRYIIEANGTGAAFIDYDNDGLLDAFLVNGSKLAGFPKGKEPTNRLYRNLGEGRFEDVTAPAGMTRSGWGASVCAGDYDNDGDTDLYVTSWGPNALFRNKGQGDGEESGFDDVAASSGVRGPETEWSAGCTFVDYDRDGLLDLFVTQYQQFDPKTSPPPGKASNCEWKGMPVYCGPRGLPFGGVTLYRNLGQGRFKDVSEESGVRDVGGGFYAFTAVAADLDQDGWTDIYIACDSTPSLFFLNNGDGTFTDFGAETGLAFNEHGFEQGGMGVGVGDFDNDGLLDLVKTNFAGDYPNLYHNLDDGVFEDIVISAGMAIHPQYVGWGVALVDLDNDGLQDVFQVNGHVYPELDRPENREESYRQPNLVYRNLGGGKFEDVSNLAGPAMKQLRSSRGAAFGDFDNDGDVDILILNMDEPPSLLRNDLRSDNHWLRVRLQGVTSNRSAIGATVRLYAGGQVQARAVLSQGSYVSHNDLRPHFGLGAADRFDRIEVSWPSGERENFPGGAADRELLLVEGNGKPQ